MTAQTVDEAVQWRFFREFCELETAVGGPDPHMAIVGWLARDAEFRERVWRAGCYIGVYNVPCAQALWENLPPERAAENPVPLADWLSHHWEGIVTRRERRAVRTPAQLARFLHEYARWSLHLENRDWFGSLAHASPEAAYLVAWEDCQEVYGLGRYVALKLLEFLRRYCGAPIQLPDLRPRGGWSPRAGLALLYPDQADALEGDDRREHLRLANSLATQTQMRLSWDGIEVDAYNLQVLLCDYKQSWVGRRQFPGRSHDSELTYFARVAPHWRLDRSMFDARAALFPRRALGELSGWGDVREELGHVLRDHSYTWSDLKFSYLESREDLAHPVPWSPS